MHIALTELTEDVVDVVDEELEKAREQLYKEIGYVENDELKYPKEVGRVANGQSFHFT